MILVPRALPRLAVRCHCSGCGGYSCILALGTVGVVCYGNGGGDATVHSDTITVWFTLIPKKPWLGII